MNAKPYRPRAARNGLLAVTAILAIAWAGEAIAEETAANFKDRFAGDPFKGRVEVITSLPEEAGGDTLRDWGRGSAQFIETGEGKLRLVLTGRIKEEGDAGFAVDGVYDEAGWRSGGDGVRLEVLPDGTIAGSGEQPPQQMEFEGAVSEGSFDLTVEVTVDEATAKGLPPGTVFRFHYDLERETEKQASDAEPPANDCARIVWQARNVAGFGGTMQLIQVPVCVKE